MTKAIAQNRDALALHSYPSRTRAVLVPIPMTSGPLADAVVIERASALADVRTDCSGGAHAETVSSASLAEGSSPRP